jgi:hypothetical protein
MKTYLFGICTLLLLLTGCTSSTSGNNSTTPDIEGYVSRKNSHSILVVNSTSKDFSSTGGINEFYQLDARWGELIFAMWKIQYKDGFDVESKESTIYRTRDITFNEFLIP